MRRLLTIIAIFFFSQLQAQTIGGNSIFNFLRLPASPLITASGGMNISHTINDVGMAFDNPSLLQPAMHAQFTSSYTTGYAGLNTYHAGAAWYHEPWKTRLAWGLQYLDYGRLPQTDASGNELGIFRPTDWVMQVSAARSYLEKWNYGVNLKFIQSSYGFYTANGLAMDVGVQYLDSSRGWSAAIVAKTMGTTLKTYAGNGGDDLPFDLQVGVTKKLAKAPLAFSLTAHHLHRLALGYNDIAFDNQVGWSTTEGSRFSLDNLLRHFVLASHVYMGEYVKADIGFNYLRRRELQVGQSGNGLTGFSLGLSLHAKKFQVRYARSHYQSNTAMNHFGLTLAMDRLAGLGK